MPQYVLNRNYMLAGQGHMINFVKGKPVHVPPELEVDAVRIGAEPVNGVKPELLPPEQDVVPVPDGADREAMLFAAYEQIVAAGQRNDFTAQGIPTVRAVEALVGFDTTKAEIDETYRKYKHSLSNAG